MIEKNNVLKARKLFLHKNVTNRDYIRDVIYFSWMRCKLHGVDFQLLDYGKFISGINMRRSFDKKYNLLIERLENLRLESCELCLVDKNGKVIYYKSFASKSVFRLLNNFTEETIGTNAIGLSIISNRDEITIGSEHYNDNLVEHISESNVYYDKYSNSELVIGIFSRVEDEGLHRSNFDKLTVLTEKRTVNLEAVNQLTVKKNRNSIDLDSTVFNSCKLLTLKEVERNAIEETLKAVDWNMKEAASILAIGRSTLYRKVKEYELNVPK